MSVPNKSRFRRAAKWALRALGLIAPSRRGLLEALEAEHEAAGAAAASEDEQDLFERLPEPMHLEHGDVQYGDGKLRFLD